MLGHLSHLTIPMHMAVLYKLWIHVYTRAITIVVFAVVPCRGQPFLLLVTSHHSLIVNPVTHLVQGVGGKLIQLVLWGCGQWQQQDCVWVSYMLQTGIVSCSRSKAYAIWGSEPEVFPNYTYTTPAVAIACPTIQLTNTKDLWVYVGMYSAPSWLAWPQE